MALAWLALGLVFAAPAMAQPLAPTPQESTSEVEYLHVDALGSIRVVTDAQGAIVSRHDYLPFGEEVPVASRQGLGGYAGDLTPASPQRFTGKERDGETGLDYYGARYYSGSIGRFTTPDLPFADQQTDDPQSWNLYSYTRNSPLKYIDRDGRGIETAWDAFNVGLGVKSLRENVKAGNYGSAVLDTLGVGIDAVAAVAPFIPGGVSSLLKVLRAGDRVDDVADLARSADAAVDVTKGAPTLDPSTGEEVGRFVVDPKGNTMIEPVGGKTVPAGPGGVDTHTLYPNGSNAQRLNPQGHQNNPTPHGHGHLPGTGPGKKGQGPSVAPDGRVVDPKSKDAHWPIKN